MKFWLIDAIKFSLVVIRNNYQIIYEHKIVYLGFEMESNYC